MNTTALVVDDEESIRYTFETFLGNAGFEVHTAASFHEAVERLGNTSYDLIFADIILGGRSGVEFLREVKERGLNVPVILVTGEPNMDTATEALRLGAYDYIAKPVNKSMLLNLSQRALAFKKVTAAAEQYRTNLDAVFRSVGEGIVIVDDSTNLVDVNDAATRICGFSREDVGRDFRSLARACGGNCASRIDEVIDTREHVDDYRIECSGGRRVVSITASPLRSAAGKFLGAVMTIKDETRLEHLERESRERQGLHALVGRSRAMQEIFSLIEDLASLPTTVLIVGESGTGKELVVDALHHRGNRRGRPLVKVNCSALTETLLESELFGHVKGSYTGALNNRVGRLERANGGTIFLDEIGDISPAVQVKLLRVLQDMEFERVGSTTPVSVDVRVIAATNADLRKRVTEGKFREDLYYRLKVVEISMPPLRQRREDIPLLTAHLLGKIRSRLDRQVRDVSADVMERFMEYDWPGNVRELEHTLEHAAVVCRGSVITVANLPQEFRTMSAADVGIPAVPHAGDESGGDERSRLVAALGRAGWNKSKAARMLGVSVRTLYRKIDKYGITEQECLGK